MSKEEGNSLFRSGKFSEALVAYDKSEEYLKFMYSVEEGLHNVEEILRCSVLLNQAACLLKLREPRKAVAKCTSVLELQPGNSKAFYRKALGESAQGNFEGARNDLRAGMQFASDVRIFEAELQRVDELERKAHAKETSILRGMFAAVSEEGAVSSASSSGSQSSGQPEDSHRPGQAT